MLSDISTFLDYKTARQEYDSNGMYRGAVNVYSMFSPAYVCSNESVGGLSQLLNPSGKTVLAVAGSGDVPLVFHASGARQVDTFDISFNAYLAMRVKIAMLQSGMPLDEYRGYLKSMQSWGHFFVNEKVTNIIHQSLNANESKYLDGMYGCGVVRDIRSKSWFPHSETYKLMQQNVPNSYKFIRSDIDSVFKYITGQSYDIIYLSNVMDYIVDDIVHEPDESKIVSVLEQFTKHLNSHGVIVVNSLMRPIRKYDIQFYKNNIAEQLKNYGDMVYSKREKVMLLKTR